MSDGDLLRAYCAGDDDAFSLLYDRHDRSCFAFIRRLLGASGEAIAEDLHQETWVAVSRGAASFDPSRSKFTTWLFTIARNKVMDHFRAEKVSSVWSTVHVSEIEHLPDSSDGPLEQAMTKQLAIAVVRAVESLPLSQREAFLLFADGEMSIEELARATGVGAETAKSRLRYAREGIRKALACCGVRYA